MVVLGGSILGEDARQFCEMAYEYGWVRPLDWSAWRNTSAGQRLMHDPEAMIRASPDDLACALTTCVRADRFCDGYLTDAFASGLITRVLVQAEALTDSKDKSAEYHQIVRPAVYKEFTGLTLHKGQTRRSFPRPYLVAILRFRSNRDSALANIKAIYEQQFLPLRETEWQAWLAGYAAAVDWASSADEATFRSSSFQKRLWEIENVSNTGPGNSVTVVGAYDDKEVVDALWALR